MARATPTPSHRYAADAALASRLATAAGDVLLAMRSAGDLSGSALGDAADRAADDLVLASLASERPGDAVLSEETPDDPARLRAARVWVVDPLDGTREYREGRDDWAVHVALVVGGDAVAGARSRCRLGDGCSPATRRRSCRSQLGPGRAYW